MTLQTLIDMPVCAADGARLGRIFNFRAERRGGDLHITHLLVGPGAWVARLHPLGAARVLFRRLKAMEIPWEAIGSVEEHVHLRVPWSRIRCEAARRELSELVDSLTEGPG